MSRRTIAIGDIHGCGRALQVLLERVRPTADDTLVLLGDYVDRGPDSRGVLDQLVALVRDCQVIPLLGNHEIMLRDSLRSRDTFEFWQQCGGQETLASYDGSLDNLPTEHHVFLQNLLPYHETDSHLFVHANYDPDLDLAETAPHLLYWEHVGPRVPRPHHSGKTVIVGHTPQASGRILDLGHLVCLDTYCFGGGWLTALDVDSGMLWQARETGIYREGKS
ncbi:MAG: metallophosphoesterase family protein [Pirellulaceae bacterium]